VEAASRAPPGPRAGRLAPPRAASSEPRPPEPPSSGLRRGEVLGLRWREVCLADPTARICASQRRGSGGGGHAEVGGRRADDLARPAPSCHLAAELFEHRRRKWFVGDDERVFCSPTKGTALDAVRFAKDAPARPSYREDRVRPFQDLRHTSITNAAAAGTFPAALTACAGHSDFRTTQVYIDLAGEERFRAEAQRLERRLWGSNGHQNWVPNRAFVAKGANGPGCRADGQTRRYAGSFQGTERRRSRTYPAWGYQTSPVLKVSFVKSIQGRLRGFGPASVPLDAVRCAETSTNSSTKSAFLLRRRPAVSRTT
jgi:hypothetical protein